MTNFEGHPGRECGEHRTVGPHRAWCYECTMWCYPRLEAACRGCELPALRAQIEELQAKARERAATVPTYPVDSDSDPVGPGLRAAQIRALEAPDPPGH